MQQAQDIAAGNESLADRAITRDVVGQSTTYAVIGLAAALLLPRLGARALWASEFRWAEIAREMLLTHNYFWPTINGHVYYDKPLGSYWLVVAATWLTGGMNEAAARLPSALAGLLAIGLLILLGRQLYDRGTAVYAALILATSFSFVFFSRCADADIETVTGELAALLLFWHHRDRPAGAWTIGLWALMAVTSLTKGLLGFALPLLIIGIYSLLADGWSALLDDLQTGSMGERAQRLIARNQWLFNRYAPLAIGVAVAIYYLPFAVSHSQTGSAKGLYMVYRENVERYFAPFDHVGPIYLYVYVIFELFAPWSVFLPAALADMHGRTVERDSRSDRFAQIFFWATFIFFTLSGSRRSYYLLPILPAAALILARMFAAPAAALRPTTRILIKCGFAVLAAAVAISTLVFIPPRYLLPNPWGLMPAAPDRATFAISWLGSIVAIGFGLRQLDAKRIFLVCAAVAWLFMFYLFVFAMPAGDAWRGEKDFAHRVHLIIGDDTKNLAFYNTGPVYYLQLSHPVPSYNPRRAGGVRWVVMRERDAEQLGLSENVVTRESVNPWDSREHDLNAMVLVRIGPPATR
jgi:4-amino-4-deoxy-L-arabinose transferase-like glycosyltransferase